MNIFKKILTKGSRFILIFALVGGLWVALPAEEVQAYDFTVMNTNDSGPGSLRQAVLDATAGQTIGFDLSIYGETIILSSAINIDKSIDIHGPSDRITISGNMSSQLFTIDEGVEVWITYINFIDGYGFNGGAIYNAGDLDLTWCNFDGNYASNVGGAINNVLTGDLTVTQCTLSNNEAASKGGAVYNSSSGILRIKWSTVENNDADFGGGLYSDGSTLNYLENSTFYENYAEYSGGGVHNSGYLQVTNCTLSDNRALVVGGDGIYNAADTLYLRNSILANEKYHQHCEISGGTLHASSSHYLVEDGSCSAPITGDPVLGPLTNNGGRTETMALGSGSPAIDAGDNGSCFPEDQRLVDRSLTEPDICDIGAYETPAAAAVNSNLDPGDGVCTWINCTLREYITAAAAGEVITFDPSLAGTTIDLGNRLVLYKDTVIDGSALTSPVTLDGGDSVQVFDIYPDLTVTLDSLTIANGSTSEGGGIDNGANTDLTIANCTLIGNSADDGGAINNAGDITILDSTFTGNHAVDYGGAINVHAGTVAISGSTIEGNTTAGLGAGIFNNLSTLSLSNSTVAGNTADQYGGGIINYIGDLTLLNTTISGNHAVIEGGGVSNADGGSSFIMKNTILANNTDGSGPSDCILGSGTTYANTNNLVENGSCSPAVSGDPDLSPLADNGGPTETMAIDSESLAFNAGDDGTCESVDQRGVSRPQGAHCDIGAFELEVVSDFDNVGFYVPGNYRWYLKTGTADGWAGVISFGWGGASELVPVVGDWDGDGVDTAAFYKPSQWRWYLKNDQNDGWVGTTTFQWGGNANLIPLAGDWDGDGDDTVGFYKPSASEWYLKDDNTGGWTGFTKIVWGGASGNIPIAGDWDGDGDDTIGFFVPSQNKWWLKNDLADGWAGVTGLNFGTADPMDPVAGDWDGDGAATVGAYVPSKWSWFLKDDQVDGWSNVTQLRFGVTADYEVLAGDWE